MEPSIPTAPDSQPGFKTELFLTESKQTGAETFDVPYTVPDNQASGDYQIKQIRPSVTARRAAIHNSVVCDVVPMTCGAVRALPYR